MNKNANQWNFRLPSYFGVGLLALLLLSAPFSVAAQQSTPTPPPSSAVTTQQLEDLTAVIKDETARKQLLSRIQALIAASKNTEQKPPIESAGARLIADLAENVRETSRQLVSAAEALKNLPDLFAAIANELTNSEIRQRWIDLVIKIALVLLAGGLLERLVRRVLRRPRQALEERDADTNWVRLPLLAGRTGLDIVPIIAFAAAAYAGASMVKPNPQIHIVSLTLINAYLMVSFIMAMVRMLLAPAVGSLRILPLSDVTANYLFIWTRRLAGFSIFGFFFAEAALLLGLPAGGHTALMRFLGLSITCLAVVFFLQNRESVAIWIRGEEKSLRAGLLRDRFADIWHVLAVIYTVAIFGVWVLGVSGGFEYLARATALTIVILIASRLVTTGMDRLVTRGFTISHDIRDRFPTLEKRANRYVPVMRLLMRWAVGLATILALLETWGVNAFGWLGTPLGMQIMENTFSVIAVVILALVFWEAVNSGVELYLTKTDTEGNVVERSARIRTLLPLLRKVVFTILAVMVSLIVLSEIGIEIGPLLAGAGVVGLAVGFGAQTLVKDVITGLFILVEDTIAVGDYVDVGGHEGTVESLSIRTIRLRDPAGSVHTVPFSDVGTVLNYTKDYSHVVLDIGIAYRENVDEVMKVIEDLGHEMSEDPSLASDIMAPLEVQGLQSLDDSAVVIRARIRVKPGTQWGLKREFNRRMKNRFDELGIEIPFPQRAITFGEDKKGNAVAGRVVVENQTKHTRSPTKPTSKRKVQTVQGKGDASDGIAGDDGE